MIASMGCLGLSDEYGSWNTGWMFWAISRRSRLSIGRSRKKILPSVGAMRPSSSFASVDFPQPDSPTKPTTSPSSR